MKIFGLYPDNDCPTEICVSPVLFPLIRAVENDYEPYICWDKLISELSDV